MPLPYPLCILVLSRNCWDKEPQKATKQKEPSSRPPHSLSLSYCLTPARSKHLTLPSIPYPVCVLRCRLHGAGHRRKAWERKAPACTSQSPGNSRQCKLQVQEQALAARAHTAALTSLSLDQSSWDYMCPPPPLNPTPHRPSSPSLLV